MKKTLLLLFFCIFSTAQNLDLTFDTDGIVNNPVGNKKSNQYPVNCELQNDGKVVYFGYTNKGGYIVRYNVDGTKDNSFNGYGFNIVKDEYFTSGVKLADDSFLVGGRKGIYKFTSNGVLDTTFNNVGFTSSVFQNQMDFASISELANGKIIATGYTTINSVSSIFVLKYNQNGSLDTTFGDLGKKIISIGLYSKCVNHKILQSGDIILTGTVKVLETSHNNKGVLIKMNENGELDNSFGTNSVSFIDYSNSGIAEVAHSVFELNDSSLLVTGITVNKFVILKYNSNGIIDATFGTNGYKELSNYVIIDGHYAIMGVNQKFIKQGSDKLLISSCYGTDFSLIRTNLSGDIDTTFGTNGSIILNYEARESATFVKIKPDGNLLFGGNSEASATNSDKIIQYELTSEGQFISVSKKELFLNIENLFKQKILPDNTILTLINTDSFNICKFSESANVDPAFGVAGFANLGTGSNQISIKNSNNIIFTINSGSLYKYNTIGQIVGLISANTVSNSRMNNLYAFEIDSNENVFLGGSYYYPTENNFGNPMAIYKTNQNGVLVTAFGSNGLLKIRVSEDFSTNAFSSPVNIHNLNDNKILVSGICNQNNLLNSFVIKMTENGVLDTSFGNNGKIYLPIENGFELKRSVVFTDNSILLDYENGQNTKLLKINANGTIDTNFGINGYVTDLDGFKSTCFVNYFGHILKGGVKNNHFCLIKYSSNGSIDTTFGINGVLEIPIGFYSNLNDMSVYADGKILLGGYSFDADKENITFARITNATLGNLDFASTENVLSIYPNPIETTATFDFTLVNSENITIELYDVQGKLVQTIATNKEMAAGNHNLPIVLNSNLASGNYFLKLSTPKGSQSIQIIKK